jgi:hypothetical protein
MNLIETLKTLDGTTYELFETGKSFKSVITTPAFITRRGENREESIITKLHRTHSAAMNSKMRGLILATQ